MGVFNNKIEIDKLKKNGGGVSPEIEEELQHLSDDVLELTLLTNANTIYSNEEVKVGTFFGKDLFKKSYKIYENGTIQAPWQRIDNQTYGNNEITRNSGIKYDMLVDSNVIFGGADSRVTWDNSKCRITNAGIKVNSAISSIPTNLYVTLYYTKNE